MRRLVITAFVSLDGVMQAPGGPEEDPAGGFAHGGWTVPYWDDAVGEAMAEAFSAPFDLLLGRRTYDIFAAHWPQAETLGGEDGEIAKVFNRVTKYVATHRPDSLSWQNSRWLGDDIVANLHEIKREDGPDLLVQGSSELLQTLFANDLVDTFRLLVHPLVLGKGKRLFGSGTLPAAFALKQSKVSPGGVVVLHYERAGDVATGSFALRERREDRGA